MIYRISRVRQLITRVFFSAASPRRRTTATPAMSFAQSPFDLRSVSSCLFVFHFIFVYWCDNGRASKMPVFHTKIIESILEPVAQQVSDSSVLHRILARFSQKFRPAFFFFSDRRPTRFESETEFPPLRIKINLTVECASVCAAYCAMPIPRFVVVSLIFHHIFYVFPFKTISAPSSLYIRNNLSSCLIFTFLY